MSDSEEKASPNKEDLSSEDIQEVGQTIEKLSKKRTEIGCRVYGFGKDGINAKSTT